ncbi:MAG: LPS export ABC transporter permease LptG [Legionellales bacterium]|nr:LPS export ABC transporter permease LptG [Legionellales bacterium]
MRILDRYIAKTVLGAITLVVLMLAGLQIFILLVSQLDVIGKGDYGLWQAVCFVFLQTPYQVYLFFPMASLLGCLIGLGILADHRELVVMRASGMSVWQITAAVLKVALLVTVMVTLVGEIWVPKLVHFSNEQKIQALNDGQALQTPTGVWLRYRRDFITIGSVLPNDVLMQVVQFHFDKTYHLRMARKIDKVDRLNGHWRALGIAETVFLDDSTVTKTLDQQIWDVPIHPDILAITSHTPDELPLSELSQYHHTKGMSRQVAYTYRLAYFQRLAQPLCTLVMMLLSIPFIFGPLRQSTMGSKILAGACVGFGFHILNHFFGPMSQVFQWPPVVAAFGPMGFFALLGVYLMRRVR